MAINIDFDVVMVLNVKSPALEPLDVNQVSYVFLLICLEDSIPLMEMSDQLFF